MRNVKTLALKILLAIFICIPSTQPTYGTGIPVIDIVGLGQKIIQVSNDVTKIANQASQIANQANQIRNQANMLRTLGPSQFGNLSSVLGIQNTEVGALLSSASEVQYALANVQAQIDNTFPPPGTWTTFDMATLGARVQQWDNTISDATGLAMRAQTSLNRVQTRNTQLQGLLSQAQTENGQVRQLQINAQINGQIAQALNDNATVTATAARAQMLEQQLAVSERELSREQHARAMNRFADRGAPITVRDALPAIVQP